MTPPDDEAEEGPEAAPNPGRDIELAPPVEEIIEQLEPFLQPGSQEQAATIVQHMLIARSTHVGPLPPAREFALYDQALPGAADRMLAMAEREQIHRHDVEKAVVKADGQLKNRGQFCAVGALAASLLVVGYFAYLDHAVSGAALGTGIIIAVVALFLGQRLAPWMMGRAAPRSDDDDQSSS